MDEKAIEEVGAGHQSKVVTAHLLIDGQAEEFLELADLNIAVGMQGIAWGLVRLRIGLKLRILLASFTNLTPRAFFKSVIKSGFASQLCANQHK